MLTRVVVSIMALMALAACGRGDAPKGQVVATVDGKEITTTELQAEIGGMSGTNAAENKVIQQQALQSIINRRILADAARNQKLEQTPQGVIARHKAVDLALIDLLQAKLRAGVPKPSREEADQFVNDHPAVFAGRKLFIVDQVIAANVPPALLKAMEPMTTMEPIVALLDANKIKHYSTVGVVDTISIDPEAAGKLAALKPGEVFLSPGGNILRISKVRDTVDQPVTGDDAINIAIQTIGTQREQAQVSQQIGGLLKAGQSKVQLNKDFSLPKPAK